VYTLNKKKKRKNQKNLIYNIMLFMNPVISIIYDDLLYIILI